ncbi:MAG: response regulator transcription factor [Ruminiclostridium sp.]|nr:response regulator transcription factor [Ruminiclostridium sp.]
MTRIMICDDEQKMLTDIAGLTSGVISDSSISAFRNGRDLLSSLKDGNCDILLLDIDMPELSGLDIARALSGMSARPLLIFVTSHDELVYDSLQFHPFGFVRKSHLTQELPKMLADAAGEISGKDKHFCFHSAEGDVKMRLDDIRYFESDGNYIKLFSSEEYRFRDTMASLENTLSENGFVRIHKGFLVNQSAVKIINPDECVLDDNTRLPIGRSYSEAARKQLMRYMLG